MKRFALPAAAVGIAAALSVLFYLGFARVYGDTVLGQVILTLSSVALLQIAVVPQSWVYVVGAHGMNEIAARFAQAATIEWAGGLVGLALLAVFTLLPVSLLAGNREAILFQFIALWAAGSTSAQGLFRAHEDWVRYALWVVTPNLLRVGLVGTALLPGHRLAGLGGDRAALVLVFFTIPDLVRYLLFNVPTLLRHYRPPPRATLRPAATRILQNWLFDMGSALTEVADKVVVGTLLGPQLLVVYFFARKLGVAATMVVEPVYAEHYRRVLLQTDGRDRAVAQRRVYWIGLATALTMAALVIASVTGGLQIAPLAQLVPESVRANVTLFIGLVLVDCLIAANRWSRYLSQLEGAAQLLLMVRILLFAGFAAALAAFARLPGGAGLMLAFGGFWIAEASFVTIWLNRALVRGRRSP